MAALAMSGGMILEAGATLISPDAGGGPPPSGTFAFNPPSPVLAGGRISYFVANGQAIGSAFWNWSQYIAVNVVTNSYPGAYNNLDSAGVDPWLAAYFPATKVPLGPGSTIATTMFNYHDSCQASPTIDLPGFWNYVNTLQNWITYNSGVTPPASNPAVTGSTTNAPNNGSYFIPNISTYCPTDSNGWNDSQWDVQYFLQNTLLNSGTYASGSYNWGTGGKDASKRWSGINFDDRWYTPLQGGDIARTGSPDSNLYRCITYNWNSPTSTEALANTWRAGIAQAFAMQDSVYASAGLSPPFRNGNFNAMSNMMEYNSGQVTSTDPRVFGALNQVFDMMEIQLFFGSPYGPEFFGQSPTGVQHMLAAAALAKAGCRTTLCPGLVQLDAINLSATGQIPANNTTWSGTTPASVTPAFGSGATGGNGFRYWVAFANIANGMFSWDTDGSERVTANLTTYDELGNNGCADCPPGYLGYVVPNSTKTYANGIIEETYQNPQTGRTWLVAMNPRGNGTKTYVPQVGGVNVAVHRINGAQNPTYNTGATVAAGAGIAMADPDGVFVYL